MGGDWVMGVGCCWADSLHSFAHRIPAGRLLLACGCWLCFLGCDEMAVCAAVAAGDWDY